MHAIKQKSGRNLPIPQLGATVRRGLGHNMIAVEQSCVRQSRANLLQQVFSSIHQHACKVKHVHIQYWNPTPTRYKEWVGHRNDSSKVGIQQQNSRDSRLISSVSVGINRSSSFPIVANAEERHGKTRNAHHAHDDGRLALAARTHTVRSALCA